jgi:hypothetical protein
VLMVKFPLQHFLDDPDFVHATMSAHDVRNPYKLTNISIP